MIDHDCLMTVRGFRTEAVSTFAYSHEGLLRRVTGFIFQYTLSGCGTIRIGDEYSRVPRHHCFMVTVPGDHHYYYDESAETEPWSFLWIRIGGVPATVYWDRIIRLMGGEVFYLPPESPPILLLRQLHQRLESRFQSGLDPYEISEWIYKWLLSLLRYASGGKPEAGTRPEPLKEAKRFLLEHLQQDISLDDAAEACGLSKPYFCSLFSRFYGISPMEYLSRERIRRAALLLATTDLPVVRIAQATGFGSSSYFGKVFKKQLGLTPLEYRIKSHDTDLPFPQ